MAYTLLLPPTIGLFGYGTHEQGKPYRTIRVYDAVTGRVALGPLKGHTRWVNGVKFSHDGTRLFSCSSDGTVRIWNVQNVDTNAGLMATPGSTSSTWSIRYAHSGKRIVSGSQDGTMHVWNTETGELVLGPLRGHKAAVACVDYSSDDQYIASASYDSTLHIWD
ncbi:WD40 domain-containing protein [Rhizoctonia solani AG-1 IA]|uniref:WD40 domain-containing protein n=1 Tax=Thanatephorus cucumeris (strain AG1-IA) TaxID=983506 RepID=L8WGQ3_THACA|nr:WD40 domain-containing protein [Rhizoctonia solani AG-1 IA]